jgi:hypothetical protein
MQQRLPASAAGRHVVILAGCEIAKTFCVKKIAPLSFRIVIIDAAPAKIIES